MTDFENHATQATAAPPNRAQLFRIVILLVHQVGLVKDFNRLIETDTMLPPDIRVFWLFKVEPRI